MALIKLNCENPDATNDYLKMLTGKEVGTPPDLDNRERLGEVTLGNFTYVSMEASSKLGFGFGTIGGSINRKVMIFDYAATAVQDDPNKDQNGISSWTYGVGYRIGILVSDKEAQFQLGIAALAATATLKHQDIQIQILKYGVPGGPSLPIVNFTTFNVEAYGKFVKWQQDVIDYIGANKEKLTPIRISAALSLDIEKYFQNTAALRYAIRRIQDRDTLTRALVLAVNKNLPHVVGRESIIRAVYAKITGYGEYLYETNSTIDNRPISDMAKKLAEDWIQEYDKIR